MIKHQMEPEKKLIQEKRVTWDEKKSSSKKNVKDGEASKFLEYEKETQRIQNETTHIKNETLKIKKRNDDLEKQNIELKCCTKELEKMNLQRRKALIDLKICLKGLSRAKGMNLEKQEYKLFMVKNRWI